MKGNALKLIAALALLFVFQLTSLGQTTGSIAGTAVDSNGAAVPSATVTVKSSSGQEFTVVTKENGTFLVPALGTGTYLVTVTAPSFKKYVVQNVKVDVGLPTTVDVSLEAGDISETVTVTGGGEVLQTQTATIGTTITGRQITETPLTSRDALDLVTLLPGTATVGRPRQSSINGLPKGSLSITIDGVDVQDNLLRSSDGFFTYVRPRLDAIEEVTVSTASPGAESSGDGAVQIKFVTKRGTNDYRGNLYWQHRDHSLNSNYWWNNTLGLPINPLILNQYGGNIGGPIPFFNFGDGNGPHFISGKDRAFFFVNYEEFRLPDSITRTRRILNPAAQIGDYTYVGSDGVTRTTNVLAIAPGTATIPNTIDPTIASILSLIRSGTGAGTLRAVGSNYQDFTFINKNSSVRKFLAARIDINLTRKHSLENVTNYQTFRSPVDFLNNVDPRFPGFPSYGSQDSDRYSNTTALRSTITNNIVNEARYSFSGGLSLFRENLTPEVFEFQGGFSLNPDATNLNVSTQSLGLAAFTASNSNNRRVSPTFDFSDNLTWLWGAHTLGIGGQYKRIKLRSAEINQLVPNVTFGFGSSTLDATARGLFNTTNFPSATSTQLGEAAALYALLSGRVSSVAGSVYLTDDGSYVYLGDQLQRAKLNTYGLYVQDFWKARTNLTLNFGLRWQPQEAFQTTNKTFSRADSFASAFGVSGEGNLFMPGVRAAGPTFHIVEPGYRAFSTDWNNFAPSIGVVWSPEFGGLLKRVFGGPGKSVFRGGYSISFVREGSNVLTSILGSNPGALFSATRSLALGNLPVGTLLRNLVGGGFTPASPSITDPIVPGISDSTNVFDPNLRTGSVHSWSFGYQRELDKNTVIEVRYVGNRGRDLWRQYNINEYNTIENGFAAEFRLAQANLLSNEAAFAAGDPSRRLCPPPAVVVNGNCQVSVSNNTPVNRVPTFAFFGTGTGTAPLPILAAYFNGTLINGGGAGNPTLYTGTSSAITFFTDAAIRNFLSPLNPNVLGLAANLDAVAAQRTNSVNAGLPLNFFLVNPSTRGGSFIVDNSGHTWYDSGVIELRRRLSAGLLVSANYTYSKSMTDFFASSSSVSNNFTSLRNPELNKTLSPFDVRHSFKVNWIYELPFGNGRWLMGNANRLTNALVGGWSVIGALRWQSGTPINFGNVQLVGMTRNELEDLIGVYYNTEVHANAIGTGTRIVPATYLPGDIIRNTAAAFNFGTPTGRFIAPAGFGNCLQRFAGECGFSNLVVHGPGFWKLDLSLSKKIKIDEKRNVELRAAFYNALNNHPFRVGGWAADTVTAQSSTGILPTVAGGLAAAERLGGIDFGQYKTGTVYQDSSTTNDPGGRIIELILRINF